MRILGVIPARGGSKGIPRKNLKELDGKPLIQHTFEEALASRELDRVILSTDDAEIAVFGRQCGVEVPFVRPEHLASDAASTSSVLRHASAWCRENEGYAHDAVLMLQPTSPLRRAEHIDAAIRQFHQKGELNGLVSVCAVREHPYDMVVAEKGRLRFFLPEARDVFERQRFPDCFFLNGAIYILRVEPLMEKLSMFPEPTGLFVMEQEDSLEIDSPLDLCIVETVMQWRRARKRWE